jgi:hypothetical protein
VRGAFPVNGDKISNEIGIKLTASDIKLEWQPRFTVEGSTDQNISYLIREFNCDGKSVIKQAGVEVDLRQPKHIGKDDSKFTRPSLDFDEYRIGRLRSHVGIQSRHES